MIKTTGAEFKRFYNDDSMWGGDSWHEDELILVDGGKWELDLADIPDTAIVKLSGGCILGLPDGREPTMEAHFRAWKKKQTITDLVVECDISKLDAIKAAIKSAGGRLK